MDFNAFFGHIITELRNKLKLGKLPILQTGHEVFL